MPSPLPSTPAFATRPAATLMVVSPQDRSRSPGKSARALGGTSSSQAVHNLSSDAEGSALATEVQPQSGGGPCSTARSFELAFVYDDPSSCASQDHEAEKLLSLEQVVLDAEGQLRTTVRCAEVSIVHDSIPEDFPSDQDAEKPALVMQAQLLREGELCATIRFFQAAVVLDDTGSRTSSLLKSSFIHGIEAYGDALNKLGARLGSPFVSNAKKLRNSRATATEDDYKMWLLSELPVHKATGYRSYVDESAWMANLWIGWSMEFFVELFALIHDGADTKPSVDIAYARTLRAHHNFIQRAIFHQVCKQLPTRQEILERWKGDATVEDALRELSSFVRLGRQVAIFCLQVNNVLDARLKRERVKNKP